MIGGRSFVAQRFFLAPPRAVRPRELASSTPIDPDPDFSIKYVMIHLLIILLMFLNMIYFVIMMYQTPRNDFGRTFLSARMRLEGGSLYAVNDAIRWNREDGSEVLLKNLNPPHFHLLLLPFARLRTEIALGIWIVAGIACFAAALRAIGAELELKFDSYERSAAVLAGLSFVGTSAALAAGHMTGILMAIFTFSWIDARRGRWTRAGCLIGLAASIKPFFLIFFPYFWITGKKRAVAASSLAIVGSFAIGALAFGIDSYRDWIRNLLEADGWTSALGNASIDGLLSRSFTTDPRRHKTMYLDLQYYNMFRITLSALIGYASLAIARSEATTLRVDRSFAALMLAALLISPLGWTYYFWLPVAPIVAIAIDRVRNPAVVPDRFNRASAILFYAALPGLGMPTLPRVEAFAPRFFGYIIHNLYFFSLFLIWMSVILDAAGAIRRGAFNRSRSARIEKGAV